MFNILKAALEITPKNEIRYYLNGLHFQRFKNTLEVHATDGRVCFKAVFLDPDVVNQFPDGYDVIMSRASIDKVLKLHKRNDNVIFTEEAGNVTVQGLTIDLIDGNFPQVERVFSNISASTRGHETGYTFALLEKVGKVGRIAMQSEKEQICKASTGEGQHNTLYTFSIPNVEMSIILCPARTK